MLTCLVLPGFQGIFNLCVWSVIYISWTWFLPHVYLYFQVPTLPNCPICQSIFGAFWIRYSSIILLVFASGFTICLPHSYSSYHHLISWYVNHFPSTIVKDASTAHEKKKQQTSKTWIEFTCSFAVQRLVFLGRGITWEFWWGIMMVCYKKSSRNWIPMGLLLGF